MYRGVGNPVIIYEGNRVDLPSPKKGARQENYIPAWKIYENIDGEIVTDEDRKWRFEGEYEFGGVEQRVVDTLIAIYNRSAIVKLIPHSDVPAIAYKVIIEEISPMPLEGIIGVDTVKIKVKSQGLVKKIPTLDNLYGSILFTRVIRYRET